MYVFPPPNSDVEFDVYITHEYFRPINIIGLSREAVNATKANFINVISKVGIRMLDKCRINCIHHALHPPPCSHPHSVRNELIIFICCFSREALLRLQKARERYRRQSYIQRVCDALYKRSTTPNWVLCVHTMSTWATVEGDNMAVQTTAWIEL